VTLGDKVALGLWDIVAVTEEVTHWVELTEGLEVGVTDLHCVTVPVPL
jgi:hypothetical protein